MNAEHEVVVHDIKKDDLERIVKMAAHMLDKAQDGTLTDLTSAVQRASEVLKLPLEIDKSKAELRKLALEQSKLDRENRTAVRRGRHERFGAIVSLLTPILSVVALAATLTFQTWQFRQTETARKEAAEEAAWTKAMDVLSKSGHVSPEVIAIGPFLHSPKHADEARTAVVRLLINTTDTAVFDELFNGLFVPVDWTNIGELLRLNRGLTPKAVALYFKTWDSDKRLTDLSLISESEKQTYNYLEHALPKLSAAVGYILRTSRPSGINLDLTGTLFTTCDWSNVSLTDAKLNNCVLRFANLENADLGPTVDFDWVDFMFTAWWKAKRLSPNLRAYLREKFPCDPNTRYGPTFDETFSKEKCAEVNGQPVSTTE